MGRNLRVVIDACALYPNLLRDTLLRLAEAELFQLVWSDELLEEVRRNLVKNGAAPPAKAERTIALIKSAFREGEVTGYEHHLSVLKNDPKDRHVVAAALEGGASLIVTVNLRDFAHDSLPDQVAAISPDDFLCELLTEAPAEVVQAIRRQAASFKKPPMEPDQLVRALAAALPKFATNLATVVNVHAAAELRALLDKAMEYIESDPPSSTGRAAVVDYLVAASNDDEHLKDVLREKFLESAPRLARAIAQFAMRDPTSDGGVWARTMLGAIKLRPEEIANLSDAEIRAMLEASQAREQ